MPYLTLQNKSKLTAIIDSLDMINLLTPGELNYVYFMIAMKYSQDKQESYQTYNDIVGALENCKLELYRRKIGFYEDKKIKENGDIPEYAKRK